MDRAARIEQVLSNWQVARRRGEATSSADLLARHTDLLPELKERLAYLDDAGTLPWVTPSGSPCPTQDQLRDLIETRLSSRNGVGLEEHIAFCLRCKEELAEQRRLYEMSQAFKPRAPVVPPVVPGHQVKDLLGWGGFGNVWLGWHQVLRQARAIKVLHSFALDAWSLEALRGEARLMAQLPPHENRVQVLDLIETEAGPVLITGFVDGESLNRLAPMPWQQAVRFLIDVCHGLQALHERGIIHRDIKPANILFDCVAGRAVLADYGLAAFLRDQPPPAGTAGFLAPELCEAPPTVKSDVFALAATLYSLLTGKPPFDPSSPYGSLLEARAGLPADAPVLASFPRGVQEVIQMGLSPNPERRPDLAGFLARLKVAHLRELAHQLEARARDSRCPVQVRVTVWVADPHGSFTPALSGRSTILPGPEPDQVAVPAGALLRIEAEADRPGYLSLFDFGGALDGLVPGPLSQSDRLEAGQSHGLTLKLAALPEGRPVAVLWTARPFDGSADWQKRFFSTQQQIGARGMAMLVHESGEVDAWAVYCFRVVPSGE